MKWLLFLLVLIPQLVFAQGTPGGGISFAPTPGDLSIVYLSSIFGVVDGVLHGTGSQILGTMFGIFNAGILTVGGVVIMYTLFVSTLNTAHQGEVLGSKWSSIWIPLRTVVGIAAMLPKATGYSFIQIIIMWLVVQGIGVADSIWGGALSYFERGGILVVPTQTLAETGLTTGSNTSLIWTSGNVLKAETCMYTLRSSLMQNLSSTQKAVPDFTSTLVVQGMPSGKTPPCYAGSGRAECVGQNDKTGIIYFPGDVSYAGKNYKGACGSMTWPFSLKDGSSDIQNQNYANIGAYDSRSIATQQIMLDMQPLAYALSQVILPTGSGQVGKNITDADLVPSGLINPTTDYMAIMLPYLRSLSAGISDALRKTLDSAKDHGWILAGSYYFTMSSLNNAVSATEKISNQPYIDYPSVYDATKFNPAALAALIPNVPPGGVYSCTGDKNRLNNYLCSEFVSANAQFSQKAITPPISSFAGWSGTLSEWATSDWIPGKIRDAINKIPDTINALIGNFQALLNAENQQSADPIVLVSAMGVNLVNAVEYLWIGGSVAILIVSLAVSICFGQTGIGNALNSFIMMFIPMLTAIFIAMFAAGAVMAYYVPLIPLIIFVFTGVGWFIAVIEAMIAGPFVALGLIAPEGHEYVGHAQHAILLLLNVFIRPTLIIFGFIAGSIIVHVGLWLLNQGLGVAMTEGGAQNVLAADFSHVLSFVAIIVIYMSLVLGIVNRSFALIHEVPTQVLQWIGGTARTFGESAAAEEAGGTAKGKVAGIAGGVGGGLGEGQKAFGKMGQGIGKMVHGKGGGDVAGG